VKIIVPTIHKIAELVRVGLAAGATGSLLNTAREDRTLEALETVMRGDAYIAPSFGRGVIAAVAK
jgi:DNA-binding NarL/FixJ family response regulator